MKDKKEIKKEDTVWITYLDDDGAIKSVPYKSFLNIAKKRGWKTNSDDKLTLETNKMLEKIKWTNLLKVQRI